MKRYILIFLLMGLISSTPTYAGGDRKQNSEDIFINPPLLSSGHFRSTAYYMSDYLSSYSNPLPPRQDLIFTKQAVFFSVGPGLTTIHNKNIFENDQWDTKSGFGISVEACYYLKFNRMFGVGAGIGYSSYKTEISAGDYEATFPNQKDKDNDLYELLVNSGGINKTTKLGYFDIPVYAEYSTANIDKIGFYGRIGIKLSFPMSNSYEATGSSTYKGYYQDYHVILYDIDYYDFTTRKLAQDENMSMESLKLSAMVSAGITQPLNENFIIKAGAFYNIGLNEISAYKMEEDYNSNEFGGDVNSLLANPYEKTTARSFGVEVGILYNLNFFY